MSNPRIDLINAAIEYAEAELSVRKEIAYATLQEAERAIIAAKEAITGFEIAWVDQALNDMDAEDARMVA